MKTKHKKSNKTNKNAWIFYVLLALGIIALVYFGGVGSITSISSQTGDFEIQKPSVCINRADKEDYSQGLTNPATFGDYKLEINYDDSSYAISCNSPPTANVRSNTVIGKDKYGCPMYQTITNSYVHTVCTGGSNCPTYRNVGITMCSQCTAKGSCPSQGFSCNGCSDEGWKCSGTYCKYYGGSCYWDYCGCSRVTEPETKTITGGYKTNYQSNVPGFTYSLYYKNQLVSSRTEFNMRDFNAFVTGIPAYDYDKWFTYAVDYLAQHPELPQNTNNVPLKLSDFPISNVYSEILTTSRLCVKEGVLQSDYVDCEYVIDIGSYGGTDCNGEPTFEVDVSPRYSDSRLYAVFDMNNSYTEGTEVRLPLTITNTYDRPMKARLTLNYAFDTFLGNLEKPISYEYDVPTGDTNIDVPFSTQKTTDKVTITPTLEYFDTGISGVSRRVLDPTIQADFLTKDTYVEQDSWGDRIITTSDWVRIKIQKFNATTVTIRAKYSQEDIEFLQMSLQEKADYLRTLDATIEEISQKISEAGLTIREQSFLINQLTQNIDEQAQYIEQLTALRMKQEGQIANLQSEIALQAEYINDLTNNLLIKAELLSQLQAENENQARLLSEMRLSFSNQAGILDALNKTVTDDAEIIRNLNLSLENEGKIIKEMKATLDEKLQIIALMEKNIEEMETIVAQLDLNNKELKKTVEILKLDNARLQAKIDAKNRLITYMWVAIGFFALLAIGFMAKSLQLMKKRGRRGKRR